MSGGNSTKYNNFNKPVQTNNLTDLRYIGNPFTWHNRTEKENASFARLDRAL